MIGGLLVGGRLPAGVHKLPMDDIREYFVDGSVDQLRRRQIFESIDLHIRLLEPAAPVKVYAAGNFFSQNLAVTGTTRLLYVFEDGPSLKRAFRHEHIGSLLTLDKVLSSTPSYVMDQLHPFGGMVEVELARMSSLDYYLEDLAYDDDALGRADRSDERGIVEVQR